MISVDNKKNTYLVLVLTLLCQQVCEENAIQKCKIFLVIIIT